MCQDVTFPGHTQRWLPPQQLLGVQMKEHWAREEVDTAGTGLPANYYGCLRQSVIASSLPCKQTSGMRKASRPEQSHPENLCSSHHSGPGPGQAKARNRKLNPGFWDG